MIYCYDSSTSKLVINSQLTYLALINISDCQNGAPNPSIATFFYSKKEQKFEIFIEVIKSYESYKKLWKVTSVKTVRFLRTFLLQLGVVRSIQWLLLLFWLLTTQICSWFGLFTEVIIYDDTLLWLKALICYE